MACSSCSGTNGVSKGCGNKGHCSSGSCNKLNTYDWLAKREIPSVDGSRIVEISFKNGARKGFFFQENTIDAVTGDMVVVDTGNGYDIGRLSLSGDLVTLQMKKKKVTEDRIMHSVIRKANQRDLEKLGEARASEKGIMIKARAISRSLGVEMKVGDVEFQGDRRKATFYYTADGRIDFRELVRAYAKEFKIKIEMRQIGSRQESARIGGVGSCGRELCCSTWLTDFKSVSTSAARYQYMAINQSKLSGQCGRLKCCLNYELDTYMDAIAGFPEKADVLKTKYGKAHLMKLDIFKGIMYYGVRTSKGRGPIIVLDKEEVKKILALNKKGEFPEDLMSHQATAEPKDDFQDYSDVTGAVELPMRKKTNKRRSKKRSSKPGQARSNKSEKGGAKKSTSQGNNSANKKSNPDGTQKNKTTGKAGKPKNARSKKRPNNRKKTNKPNSNNQGPSKAK